MAGGDSQQGYATSVLRFSKNVSVNRSIVQKSARLPDGWWNDPNQHLSGLIYRPTPIVLAVLWVECGLPPQDSAVSCANEVVRLIKVHRRNSGCQSDVV